MPSSILDDDELGVVVDLDGDVTCETDLCARCGLLRRDHAGENPDRCPFYEVDDGE